MRFAPFALLLAATLANAQAPRRDGTYRAADGKTASWRIDDDHGLVWSGARYTPVGVRVAGNATAVGEANAAGVKDLLIDLPTGGDWQAPVAAAEANGQRYLVRLASKAPSAAGIAVDPAAYRVAGLVGPRHVDVAVPGASRALVVVALKRDATTIVRSEVVPIKDGRLVYDTKTRPELETVMLIYPEVESLDVPDLWEGLDAHRDALLGRLRRAKFGSGLRGIVDPLGQAVALPGREIHGVPTSPAFRAELAALLERKHTTLDNAMKAWSLGASTLTTTVQGTDAATMPKVGYMDLARLVPLWSGTRGVTMMWDPQTGRLFKCDSKSQAWEDIGEAIALAAKRRAQRLCAAIRQVVDVPVVQEWANWAGVTEDRESAFDGMAARSAGTTPSALVSSAARAVSTVARWSTPGWLVATDVAAPKGDLQASLDDLANLGLGAAFVDAPPSFVAPVAKLRESAPPPASPLAAIFFPENATNPAAVQRLPGGRWWLPTPEDGNRLDLGDAFYGYRMSTPTGNRVVMWAKVPGRYLLRLRHPETVVATTIDGSDPAPRKAKGGLMLALGELPVAIEGLDPRELPVPDIAIKETLDRFAALLALSNQTRRGGADEKIMFSQAAQSVDDNPYGSFLVMRAQLRHLAALLSPLSWIEAESTKDTTFSEIAPVSGASNDQALTLRALLPSAEGFVATYEVPAKGGNEVEMWIAARIDPERRGDLEAVVGGQTLLATEPPVSGYGAGFAWYRLGTTRLTGPISKVVLRVRSGVGSETAIDALVFAPAGWRPNGIAYPYDLVVPPKP